MAKPWSGSAKDLAQYTYKRGGNDGDIEVFATSETDAMITLAQHGFTKIDRSKLYRSGKTLAEYLVNAAERPKAIE